MKSPIFQDHTQKVRNESKRYQIPPEGKLIIVFVLGLLFTSIVGPVVNDWKATRAEQRLLEETRGLVSYPWAPSLRGEGNWSGAIARTFFFDLICNPSCFSSAGASE